MPAKPAVLVYADKGAGTRMVVSTIRALERHLRAVDVRTLARDLLAKTALRGATCTRMRPLRLMVLCT
jgi:hypothetical protein